MASAPVRLSLVMKAMKTVCTYYREVVRESKAKRKKAKKERKRIRRHEFRTDLIARGLMTIEAKKKYEKEEEETDSEDYDVWSVAMDKNERHRIDGIVAEHLAVFEVSGFLLGRYIDDDDLRRYNYESIGAAIPASDPKQRFSRTSCFGLALAL